MRYNRSEVIEESRRIFRLAWPITLTSLNWTLMHLIDVAVVGQAGTDELGALAAARTITFISIVMGLAGLSGVLVFTARADGAGEAEKTGDILHAGLMLGALIGIVCLVGLLAYPQRLLGLIGVAEELRAPGAAVVAAMAIAYPSQLIMATASYFLEGTSHPRRVMVVNLGTLPINAVLAWAWVGGHLGLPAEGAVGAALATSTASAVGAIAMVLGAWMVPKARDRAVRDLSLAAWRRALALLPGLIWFGSVPAIAAALELAGFSWLIALSTQLGVVTAAAFQAMFSLHNLVFALAMGFGSAAGVRVGNAVGAGERAAAWPRTLIAGALSSLVLGTLSLVYMVAPREIVSLFSDDLVVRDKAAFMLVLMAPFMIFDGLQYVLSYALRSLGEQVWAGINGVISFFIISGGLGWWFVRTGWGSTGLVLALGAGMLACAALNFVRLVVVLRVPGGIRTRP